MLSSRGGNGRGIGTSPYKAFVQSSQQTTRNTVDGAKWTSTFTKSLLEACAEEIEDFGSALSGFNHQVWVRIRNAFVAKTGKLWAVDELKNRHNRLKDDWKAWIMVALGRDPKTGVITGPHHWWANMIARNKDVVKFKDQGLEHENLMERVFGGDVTAMGMGKNAIFPGEGLPAVGKHAIFTGQGLPAVGKNVTTFPGQGLPAVGKNATTFPGEGLSDIESDSEGSEESYGHRVHGDPISASIAQLIDSLKFQPKIVINRRGKWGVDDAIKKLQSLPFFENEGENDDFYSWACRLFVRQQDKIDIFCETNTVSRTVKWLSDEHALAEEWFWKAPPTQMRGLKPPPFPHDGAYH